MVSMTLPDGRSFYVSGPVDVPDCDIKEFMLFGFTEYIPPPENKVDPMDVMQKAIDKMAELIEKIENRPAPVVHLTISQPKTEKIVTAERMPDGRMVGRITTQSSPLTISAVKEADGTIKADFNE